MRRLNPRHRAREAAPGEATPGLLSPPLAAALLLAACLTAVAPADARELHGVSLPETMEAAGVSLQLNGMGIRTFSFLHVPVYVAGLYVGQPSHDAAAILRSPEPKLLELRFIHDISAEQGRKAWMEGFQKNCREPCQLPAEELGRFIATVPAVRSGDRGAFLFTDHGFEASVNGKQIGSSTDAAFGAAVLGTFLGPEPPTPELKQGLLGIAD